MFGSRPSSYRTERAPGSKQSNGKTGRGHTPTHTGTQPHKDSLAHIQPKNPESIVPQPHTPRGPSPHLPRQALASTLVHTHTRLDVNCNWAMLGACTRIHPRSPHAPRSLCGHECVRCTHAFFRTALLTTCSSSRLSLESSALCVDSAARTPLPSVTPLSFSPSVGGMWGMTGAQALSKAQPLPLWVRWGQWCLLLKPLHFRLLPALPSAPPVAVQLLSGPFFHVPPLEWAAPRPPSPPPGFS